MLDAEPPLLRPIALLVIFVASLSAVLGSARPLHAADAEAPPPGAPARAAPEPAPPAPPAPAPAPPAEAQPAPAAPAPAASAPADPQLVRARAIVATAEPLFAGGHFAAALAEYTRAYEELANHPRQYWVLHNLAVCNERLFRYDEAMRLYEEYLRRAPPEEPDRKEVEAVVRSLRSLLATLVVQSSVPAEVWLDARRLGQAPGRFLIPAGRHVVELRAPRYESERREVAFDPGGARELSFELRRLSTYKGPSRAFFWTAVGLSGATAVAGTTFGLLALSSNQEGQAKADVSLDTSEISERARKQALAADICFGAAVVFGATATVLYFVTDWSETSERAAGQPKPATPRVTRIALGARGLPGVTFDAEF
jgi:tetratricopeptide (TPR) repeat protein